MSQEAISPELFIERQQFVESAKVFLETERNKLDKMLESLGFTMEQLLKSEKKQMCPYNEDHIIPEQSFKKHTEICKLLKAGYQKDELSALLQETDFAYEKAESILKIEIDEKVLNKVIWDHCIQNGQVYTGHRSMPVSHIDENIILTQEDRLALYKHVVKVSHEAGKVIPVDRDDELLTTDWGSLVKKGLLDEQNNKQYSSKLEQLAVLRDLKRRRQSYRAKNVHITKKSYTEIIREVISNQMEILVPESSSRQLTSLGGESEELPTPDKRHESRKDDSRDKDSRRDYRSRYRQDSKDYEWNRSSKRDRSRDRKRSRETSKERDRSNYRSRETCKSREKKRGQKDSYKDPGKNRIHRDDEGSTDQTMEFDEGKQTDCTDCNTSRSGTDANLLCEIKTEKFTDDNASYESTQLLKTSCSDSDSDDNYDKKSKHKKSKHKKKHGSKKSKKHKRKY
ncbi:unnamed protein product [Lymnaea stagnalis]|uniref:CHHC U11-48K-type domain-containing protein n=1 Tax=Lymnaea stagnalis TaxID=6523 RepID=A0AAV2H5T3_LYMST